MKGKYLLIGIICLVFPIAARYVWFYRGAYNPQAINIPDYQSMAVKTTEKSTPIPAVMPADKNQRTILLDQTHNNLFTLSELELLNRSLANLGAQVIATVAENPLSSALKSADAYVVIAPALSFTAEELDAVRNFVNRGGRLMVVTDPTRISGDPATSPRTSVDVANLIISPFRLAFEDTYLYNMEENGGNFRNIILKDFSKSALTEDLKKLVFFSAHSIRSQADALILTSDTTLSSLNDHPGNYTVAATSKDGNVLALGDFSFMTSSFYLLADNQILLRNISHYLTSGDRIHDLVDLPHLFTRPVDVYPSKDVELDNDLIAALGGFQKAQKLLNIKVEMAEKPGENHDLLVLGSFPPADDLKQWINEFKLEFITEEKTATKEKEKSAEDGLQPIQEKTPFPSVQASHEAPLEPLSEKTRIPQITPTHGPFEFTMTAPVSEINASATPTLDITITETSAVTEQNDASLPTPEATATEENTRKLIKIPGYGRMPVKGLGLILFNVTPNKNTLVLLAETPADLSSLVGIINEGLLSNCVIQGRIAACKIGSGAGEAISLGPIS